MIVEDIKLCITCKSRLYKTGLSNMPYYCEKCGTYEQMFCKGHEVIENND